MGRVDTDLICGLDVGGTKCAAVLLDSSGTEVAASSYHHGGPSTASLLEICRKGFADVLAEAGVGPESVGGVGIAVAGLISSDLRTVLRAPTLGARAMDLASEWEEETGAPCWVINDAHAALFAYQARHPMGSGATRVLLTLGTGLGGAIMTGDRVHIGSRGVAAECGHITVDDRDDRVCPCGARGCVENFASGRGIQELAKRLSLSPSEGASAADVVSAAEAGAEWAKSVLALAGEKLGRAMTILTVILDPEEIVISGTVGVAAQGWLVPSARREMEGRWPFGSDRPMPTLVADECGPFLTASGAALFARTRVSKEEART